jgi:hypothetical protein
MKLGRLGLALFLGPPFLAAAVPDKVEGTLTVIVADDLAHHQSQTSYFVRASEVWPILRQRQLPSSLRTISPCHPISWVV